MSRSSLHDFEILARLGAGSFGTVFKVKRFADDSFYVIKNVRIAELSFKEQNEAINEVQILAQLKSPYVVRYYDSFIEHDSLHIVMEFCNRGDLQNLLKKAKEKNVAGLKESVIWGICLQVILGLYYLHKKHILHRDLKCANVFLTKDPSSPNYLVKIGDLGVAKLMDTSTALASTIVGTPYYLSPELCKDMPYRDKSDCWALGVIIYECCTLQRPFEARNQCALIMKIIESPVEPPPSTSNSQEMINLVLWLLQKDPIHRPSTRQILNEVVVRERLQECMLSAPDDLPAEPVSSFLRDKDRNFRLPFVVPAVEGGSPLSSREGLGIAYPKAAQRQPESRELVLEGPAAVPEKQQRTVSRTSSSQKVNGKALAEERAVAAAAVSKVRGDRVRGGAKRVPSERALLRYQTRPSASSGINASDGVEEVLPADSKDVQPLLSAAASLRSKSMKAILDGEDAPLALLSGEVPLADAKEDYQLVQERDQERDRGQKDSDVESGQYEDDFETEEEEAKERHNRELEEEEVEENDARKRQAFRPVYPVANNNNNNNTTANKFTSSTMMRTNQSALSAQSTMDISPQLHGGEEDSELWNSVWTEKRGVIGFPHRPPLTPATEEVEERGDGGENKAAQLETLQDLIKDAKEKAMTALGDDLFWKVYDLCSKHMGGSGEAYEEAQQQMNDEDTADFIQELEDVLCEQSHTGIEMACEAVFGVKLLLALESKYNFLQNDSPPSKSHK